MSTAAVRAERRSRVAATGSRRSDIHPRFGAVEPFTVAWAGGTLAGEVLLPPGAGPHPIWLDVPSAGPATRGQCTPRWQAMAPAGYAVVRWDRPGCGASTGEWTSQTIAVDRAREVLAVAGAVRTMNVIDKHCLVAAGFGEAAWAVLAAAACDSIGPFPLLAGVVVISASMRYDDREERRLRIELPRRFGASAADVEHAVALFRRQLRMIRGGAPLPVVAGAGRGRAGTRGYDGRFGATAGELDYASRNLELDATPLLAQIHCPVLALWGTDDVYTDVERTEAGYRSGLRRRLTSHAYPGADHRLCIRDADAGIAATVPGMERDVARWSRRVAPRVSLA